MLPDKFTNSHPLVPGKNATVFRATNTLVGRNVFLKVYPIPENDTGSALREPRLLTELEHPNLARIYGADTLPEHQILLEMELIAGGSFQDLIDKAVATAEWPSTHTCIELVRDVAAGLSHLSTKGFVHRDVKPANLVIRLNGNQRQGVVTDLGLASKLNEQGRAFATRHARIYRPPEVWAGAGYSAKSDVYQLGIVLFQLLGGRLDYDLGNLDDAVLSARAQTGILDISTIGPDVDQAVRKVIKTAVAPEDERYSSMADFLVALTNAKLQQLDWTFKGIRSGFTLERKDRGTIYRVEVTVGKNQYQIKRSKTGKNGKFRYKKPDLDITHTDIGTCRRFRSLLEW
jgi:serine/threonine protein kinase